MVSLLLSGCTSKNEQNNKKTDDIKQKQQTEVLTPENKRIDSNGLSLEKDENIFKDNSRYNGNINSLFQTKKGIKCTQEDSKQGLKVVLYIDGSKQRMKIETTIGKNSIYTLKTDDKSLYIWNQLKQGATVEERLQKESYSSKMVYQNCSEWKTEEPVFVLPTDVDFKNDIYKVTSVLNPGSINQ